MVASSPLPAPDSLLPPEKHARALECLQSPRHSLEQIAEDLGISLHALNLFLTSETGLALLAEAELANAVRIRAAAAAQLHEAISALSLVLQGYAHTATHVHMDTSRKSLELQETQSQNARRAAHLLFRLSHFTPRPIRAYTAAPARPVLNTAPEQPEPPVRSNPAQANPARSVLHAPQEPKTPTSQQSHSADTVAQPAHRADEPTNPTHLSPSHPNLRLTSEPSTPRTAFGATPSLAPIHPP